MNFVDFSVSIGRGGLNGLYTILLFKFSPWIKMK